MQSEVFRVASFKKAKKYSRRSSIQGSRQWPHPTTGDFAATPESLAEAGFYHDPYALYPDNVTCFLCKEEYAEWEHDDDPHEIHIKISPKCPWALLRCAIEFDKNEEGNFQFRTKGRIPTSRVLEKARLDSYGNKEAGWWPHESVSHGCNAKNMAKAGFVFTPEATPGDDTATCMYCDTTLSGWEVDDDPLVEHARRPAGRECAFILALNATKPEPKARKAKARPPKNDENVESDSDYDSKPMAKKKSKPRATKTATPAKAIKKTPRAALVGLDINAPGPIQGAVVIKPTTGRLQEIFGNYQTIKKLGSGTFGEVYLGVDLVSKGQVAIKLESIKASVPMLELESKMYAKLQGSAGVPVMKWYGTVRDCNVLVLPVLGRSLSSVLHACGGRFSLPTVLMLADELICRVQALHANNMIHRDLKPDNFLIGREPHDKTIYVIDFGMAKVYRDERGYHIPWRTNKGFWGNPRYASIGAHEGNEQSRRNDMEALGYILVDFLHGDLPWPPLQKGPDGNDDYKPIGRAKRDTPVHVLCAGLPVEFATFLRHAKGLSYEAKPDYDGMRQMFKTLAWRLGYGPNIQYDWYGR